MVKPHYAVVHSRLGKRERQVSQARSKRSHEMAAKQQRMAEFYAFITPAPFLPLAVRSEEQERLLIRRPITRA